jgi:hypothetical protein
LVASISVALCISTRRHSSDSSKTIRRQASAARLSWSDTSARVRPWSRVRVRVRGRGRGRVTLEKG